MLLSQLIVELIFDVAAVIMGVMLILRARDNRQRFYWGLIATLIGITMSWENIVWIDVARHSPQYEYTDILNIEKMLKWYVLASMISLFPLASLRPGYLNHFRAMAFLLPPIIVVTAGICYILFNGHITEMYSISQIAPNIDKLDVKLRLTVFSCSILTPLVFFFYPIINNKTYRKITSDMYLLIGFLFVQYMIYFLFTLYINPFLFNALGITAVIFALTFSLQYLRSENPFSVRIQTENPDHEQSPRIETSPLFYAIDTFVKENHLYTDPDFNLEKLAKSLGKKEYIVSATIKSGGYTGFREYINNLRLEYFRYQAAQKPRRSVKQLMHICGFTSKATFYRIFAQQYGTSPTEYIKNQD